MITNWFRFSFSFAGALLASGIVQAQSFPSKPIALAVPFPAGATVDITARRYADVVGKSIGQRIVVENRSGGGGIVAAVSVKNAQPDGHTLFLTYDGPHAMLPAMQSVPYDPIKDFAPVALLWTFSSFVTVPGGSPVKSLADLVSLARTKPNGLSYGSQGVGSPGHIQAALFQKVSGLPMTHIPYKGGAPMLVDLVAGRVDLAFGTYLGFKEQLRDGRARFLATTATERFSLLPDVPTMKEAGYPVEWAAWFGLVAPAGTPRAVIEKLNSEFNKAARDPDFMKTMAEDGINVKINTPGAFAEIIARDGPRMVAIVKEFGIRAD